MLTRYFKTIILTLILLFTFKVNYLQAKDSLPITINTLMGLSRLEDTKGLINIQKLGIPSNRSVMLLEKNTAYALKRVYSAFKKQYPNIPFIIISGTRNFEYQKGIWNRKWKAQYPSFNDAYKTAKNILLYSSMPGTSRHHWGTDFDITSLDSSYFQTKPEGKTLYQWLLKNMPKYGFCQPFSPDRSKGYQLEEWHWSYKPISSLYLKAYGELLKKDPKSIIEKMNFEGSQNLPLESLVKEYVFSINKECY